MLKFEKKFRRQKVKAYEKVKSANLLTDYLRVYNLKHLNEITKLLSVTHIYYKILYSIHYIPIILLTLFFVKIPTAIKPSIIIPI